MIRRVRKLVSLILRRTLITLIGWLFFIPLAYLIPQKKKSVVIFGREKFVDNLKYFFLYLCGLGTDEVKVSMLLKDKHTYQILKAKGLPVLFYPTPKSILETMRASMVIDAGTSLSGLGYYFSYRACTVMLWHGAGMKLTRKTDKIMGQSRLLNALYNIFRVQLPYDIFISTSAFYTEHVFSKNNKRAKIFRSQEILESGYPRNDCFFREIGPLELIGSDAEILQKAKDARADG
ncbi:MAG: CDP-glycerol glycerophosphotransferase family protein, partial [Bacillota bacterium]